MEEWHLQSAELARRRIASGTHDRVAFREALLAVPSDARDTWLDHVLGLGVPPNDGAELPRGCVPYLPCGIDALVEVVDRAEVGPTDVFVDVGSGVGRAIALVHLLTGAAAIGIEVQAKLVEVAREVARSMSSRVSTVHGDAVEIAGAIVRGDASELASVFANGSVFFLYCPFSGERLQRVLAALEQIARSRPIRVCCVDLPLPACPWLVAEGSRASNVTISRSVQLPSQR